MTTKFEAFWARLSGGHALIHILTHPLESYRHWLMTVFAVISGLMFPSPLPKPYSVATWHRSGLYAPSISGKQALRLAQSPDPQTRDLAQIFIAMEQAYGGRKAIATTPDIGVAALGHSCDTDTNRPARAFACYWLGILRSQGGEHDPALIDYGAAQTAFAKGIEAGSAQSAFQAGIMLKFHHYGPTLPIMRQALAHAQAAIREPVRPGMPTGQALIRLSAAMGYHTGCFQYGLDLIADYARLRHTHPAAARRLHQRGARWMVTAATLPYPSESAERYVGDAWANGYWHLQDSKRKAKIWYTKALHNGSPRAAIALAMLYGAREITPPSAPSAPVRAYADAAIAAALTQPGRSVHQRAKRVLSMVGAPLDAAQRHLAMAYAHRLVAQYPRLREAIE